MSETINATASEGGNTWDYRDHQNETPVKAEAKVGEEAKEPATEPAQGEPAENKPWLGKKSETPGWAKKRFKEYSSTVSELKAANAQLMEQMKEVLGHIKPDASKLKESDFPDKPAFDAFREEQRILKLKEEMRKEQSDRDMQIEEQRKLQDADRQNVERAKADLADYEDAIQQGDPDIRLPAGVVQHLSMSPAGPYVKYRLATDDEFAEQVKRSDPQTKMKLIAELHDSILEQLIQRQKSAPQTPAQSQAAPAQMQTGTPSVQRKAPPPKAPPAVKGNGSTKNPLNMSGDEYARYVNSQKQKK